MERHGRKICRRFGLKLCDVYERSFVAPNSNGGCLLSSVSPAFDDIPPRLSSWASGKTFASAPAARYLHSLVGQCARGFLRVKVSSAPAYVPSEL